jgi:small subunit ribosomal protein S20
MEVAGAAIFKLSDRIARHARIHGEIQVPNVRSAEKRARQNRRGRERNRHDRTRLRTAIKKVRQAVTAEDARTALASAESIIDRLARKGVIHRNVAGRTKSRLHAHVSRLT